jgi:calsyntenin 1
LTPGVIRNTEPLDYEKNHNHILQVVAFDCGMKRSDPVLVSVKVNRVCRLGWTGKKITTRSLRYQIYLTFSYPGIPDRVEYVPGSGRQDLFPDAQINLCDFPCQPESIQARITLATSHLGKSCDRDTYTVQVNPNLEQFRAPVVRILATHWRPSKRHEQRFC